MWSDFDKYGEISDKYLPVRGQGDTLATQTVTAINKLIYKWFNDGDVYDNTYYLIGWANDLSSYANWLVKYMDAGDILNQIADCYTDEQYEGILMALAKEYLQPEKLVHLDAIPARGDIYDCSGIFRYSEGDDELWEDQY